jgi:hypothetical protein
MNYIQRLFDSAAGAAPVQNLGMAPAGAVNSPVMAADQRLAIFPGLVDPFSPQPGTDAPLGPQDAQATPRRAATPDLSVAPRQTEAYAGPAPGRSDTRPPKAEPGPQTASDTPAPARINPLQRLVEIDPLPSPRARVHATGSPADIAGPPVKDGRAPTPLSTAQPEIPARGAEATAAAAAPLDATPLPAAMPAADPAMRNPTAITPDQFTPFGEQSLPPAPMRSANDAKPVPDPAQPDLAPAPLAPAIAPPVTSAIAPTRAEPLAPSASQAPSPFARTPDLPPPPTQQVQHDPPPAPERIIERIREVPVAPAPPPKPMTAAAQSVIGSLSGRGFGWQPRQGGL